MTSMLLLLIKVPVAGFSNPKIVVESLARRD